MRLRSRKGVTLIELVVALAVFVVVIAGVSAALGAFLKLKSTYDQQMVVQQNFGVAVSKISQDMRAAVAYGSQIVQEPSINTMGDRLRIYLNDPANASYPQEVTYQLQSDSSGVSAVKRQVVRYTSYGTSDPTKTQNEPVTEGMHQLVKLYFATDAKKVVVMMVGETTYGGKLNKTSFTSLIYTRNTGYPSPSS